MAEAAFGCPVTKGERILAALDGSEHSERVFDQALSMAKICNSKLFAISVVDLHPKQMEVAPALLEKRSAEAKRILERAKQKAEQENIACETILHMGVSANEFILQEAKEKDIDLIVIGTHGTTGLKKVVMGSVAGMVIQSAPCAVLVSPL
jgi:nucleotide-binding universal stress UspA family protein